MKMSLANLQGKMSRNEMKKIMAGSGNSSNCARYYCGAENKSCCSPYDICSDASKKAVCIKR